MITPNAPAAYAANTWYIIRGRTFVCRPHSNTVGIRKHNWSLTGYKANQVRLPHTITHGRYVHTRIHAIQWYIIRSSKSLIAIISQSSQAGSNMVAHESLLLWIQCSPARAAVLQAYVISNIQCIWVLVRILLQIVQGGRLLALSFQCPPSNATSPMFSYLPHMCESIGTQIGGHSAQVSMKDTTHVGLNSSAFTKLSPVRKCVHTTTLQVSMAQCPFNWPWRSDDGNDSRGFRAPAHFLILTYSRCWRCL